MHLFVVLAYVAVANKLIQRYRRGSEVAVILSDPANVRTLAQFELADAAHARSVLEAIANALALDGWVVEDLVLHAHRAGRHIDVVRLVACGDQRYTLELTRSWTGAELGAPTRAMLIRIHDVLASDPAVHHLGWHQRQDRALAIPFTAPVAV